MHGLEVDGLQVRFGDRQALDRLSLSVRRGQLLGFLGPNGSGKTTTMRAVLGLVRPDAGEVRWDGVPIDAATRRTIGYMPEERGLYPRMRVHDQVAYFGRLAGLDASQAARAASHWLDRLGIGDRADSRVQELSHGNQQRVQLAVALVHDPPLLVLDEPFSGLDPLAARLMSAIVAERADAGAAVLFSSHQLDLVEGLCDDVAIVREGRVVASGTVDGLRAASPHRVLRVELERPASADSPVWPPALPDAVVRRLDATHLEAEVDRATPVDDILRAVAAVHEVRAFSYTPPRLGDIFVEVVA